MKIVERGAPIEGSTFHFLRVLREDTETLRDSRNQHYWCRCRCGSVISVSRSNLLTEHTRSCGCLRRQYRLPADLQETYAQSNPR